MTLGVSCLLVLADRFWTLCCQKERNNALCCYLVTTDIRSAPTFGSPVLQATPLQTAKPVLYAKCLQLLQTVAAAPLTCEPVFRLLHPQEATGPLLPSLAGVLLQPLPVEDAALTEASPTVHAQVG